MEWLFVAYKRSNMRQTEQSGFFFVQNTISDTIPYFTYDSKSEEHFFVHHNVRWKLRIF